MKVAIFQISDIHLSSERDFVVSRLSHFVAASKEVVNDCQKVLFVLAGDIANTGTSKEYKVAQSFFKEIENGLKNENLNIQCFDYIIVPGNHDCNLPKESDPIRDTILSSVKDKDSIDQQKFVDLFMSVQEDYWKFYSSYCAPEASIPFISQRRLLKLDDNLTLEFHLYNTSMMSSRNEVVGGLIVPENAFLSRHSLNKDTIVISVFHHNTGWLSSATPNNNKKRFESHLLKESNIVICGHEHDCDTKIMSELSGKNSLLYFEGSAFQHAKTSAFNILEIDTISHELVCHKFEYKSYDSDPKLSRYVETVETPVSMKHKSGVFTLSPEFENELMRFNLPIKVKNKPDLSLKDIYVYPDLDPVLDNIDSFGQYIDSSELVDESNLNKTIIIEGESQSGKTSLLGVTMLNLVNKGLYPIMLKGHEINSERSKKLIEKAYKIQYDATSLPFELYIQQRKEDKVILIDNFDNSLVNEEIRKTFICELEKHFGTVILATKESIDLHSINYSSRANEQVKHYRISSFGCVKRNELIEKWVRLNSDPKMINQEYVEEQVKMLFDQVGNLLGEQFITPYPVFLLSMLQSLGSTIEPFQIEQTYYAYCYSSLILLSIQSTGVDSDTQKEYLNFLKELAYYFYTQKKVYFSKKYLEEFFKQYKNENIYKSSLESTIKKLCDANILRETDKEVYKFSYKYIFYYLIAQKISEFIYKDEGRKLVNDLCSEIYNEESANILIFLVYHSKDTDLIETLLLTAMDTFSSYAPITMANDDGFLKKMSELIGNVKNNVLIKDIDPKNERKKGLVLQDKRRHKVQSKSVEEEQAELEEIKKDKNLRDIIQTFRAIKILGQIIKNQKFSIGKTNISNILQEAYLSCFRLVSFYSHYLESEEDNIVKAVLENNADNPHLSSELVQQRVEKLLSSMLYRICLGSFSNLSLAVGTQNIDEEYDKVAQAIGTPAAKLISFTIKSFYGPMSITELEELIREFSGNHLATHILKARVLKYVYNNTITYQKKQKIGQICGMKLINSADISKEEKRAK